MTERHNEEVLRSLTEVLAERVKRSPLGDGSGIGDALASVQPSTVEEVSYLAQVAARHSLPLVPLGAETGFGPRPPEGSILVRFDLMRGLRLPEDDEPWVEAGGVLAEPRGRAACPRLGTRRVPHERAAGHPWAASSPPTASAWAPSSLAGCGRTSYVPMW